MLNNVTYKVSEFRSDFPAFPKKKKTVFQVFPLDSNSTQQAPPFRTKAAPKVGDKTVTLVSHQAVSALAFWVISLINSAHLITSN